MNKETIRPLLAEELVRLKNLEKAAFSRVQAVLRAPHQTWPEVVKAEEEWKRLRVKRAQAELQIWLADQEWERQSKEEMQAEFQALVNASPASKV